MYTSVTIPINTPTISPAITAIAAFISPKNTLLNTTDTIRTSALAIYVPVFNAL